MSKLEQMRWRIAHLSQGNYGDSEYYMLLSSRDVQDIEMLLEVAEAAKAFLRADQDYGLAIEGEVSAATDALRAALAKLEEVNGG